VLDRLWAGWRSSYVKSLDSSTVPAGAQGSLFERILATTEPDETAGIIHRGPLVAVILNAYPYGSGHVLVLPNRAVGRLAELDADESRELWQTVQHAVAVIETVYKPGGVNVGLNQGSAAGAGVPDHLHVHVLPRWNGDTNFMTTVAETRVLPEPLEETARRLRAQWQSVQ
jgi:diadenosine tetraphosphate (Ap4A) HIT family hydrolase